MDKKLAKYYVDYHFNDLEKKGMFYISDNTVFADTELKNNFEKLFEELSNDLHMILENKPNKDEVHNFVNDQSKDIKNNSCKELFVLEDNLKDKFWFGIKESLNLTNQIIADDSNSLEDSLNKVYNIINKFESDLKTLDDNNEKADPYVRKQLNGAAENFNQNFNKENDMEKKVAIIEKFLKCENPLDELILRGKTNIKNKSLDETSRLNGNFKIYMNQKLNSKSMNSLPKNSPFQATNDIGKLSGESIPLEGNAFQATDDLANEQSIGSFGDENKDDVEKYLAENKRKTISVV